jgi:CDP-diacylglycerol--glycerol-3-phosphate 3-phosphatidyltransferase
MCGPPQHLVAISFEVSQTPRVNLPNAITFSRLILTAVFVAGTAMESVLGHWIALVSFVIAAISDFVDGWLARKLGLVTPMGKLMDPLADKVLVGAAFIYLSTEGLAPVWVTVLIIAREFMVTGLRQIAMEAGQVMAADRLGKWKTGLQLTFCITCLVWFVVGPMTEAGGLGWLLRYLSDPESWLTPVSLWAALALTVISGWNYLWSCRSLLKAR